MFLSPVLSPSYPSSSLVIVELDECGDVTSPPPLAPPGVHKLLRLPVAEVDVIAAATPLPLAVCGDVSRVVVARTLHKQKTTVCKN